jgi:hypothetical protein
VVVTIWRGREKLHYLNPVPIHEIAERWIDKFERGRLRVPAELKKQREGGTDGCFPLRLYDLHSHHVGEALAGTD